MLWVCTNIYVITSLGICKCFFIKYGFKRFENQWILFIYIYKGSIFKICIMRSIIALAKQLTGESGIDFAAWLTIVSLHCLCWRCSFSRFHLWRRTSIDRSNLGKFYSIQRDVTRQKPSDFRVLPENTHHTLYLWTAIEAAGVPCLHTFAVV